MMDYETFCKLRKMYDQDKLKSSQIAKELSLDQRTVIRWIGEESYRPRKSTVGISILAPYKAEITECWKSILIRQHRYFNSFRS